MTNLPDDHIDPYESRLTRRVGAFAEQAVRPIDPGAIAAAAHAGARRGTFAGRLFGSGGSTARLGVLLAGALVGATALAVFLVAGGNTGPIANSPTSTPTEAPGPVAACTANHLSGAIQAWEGAAGHRIATIHVSNVGPTACLLPQYLRPALIDGNGHALIVGQLLPEPAPITLPATGTAQSMVDMANYCGAAPTPADKPLKLRLYLPDESSIELPSLASLPLPADPPPCNGPNQPASIEMHAFQLLIDS